MRHRLSIDRCGPPARRLLAALALAAATTAAAGATPPGASPASAATAAVTTPAGAVTTPTGAAATPPAAAVALGHPRERGFPLIQSYVPAIAGAQSQNFYVARDPLGFLYVANLGGLLVYDGAWWQRIPIGRQKQAFAVACDAAGRVAVGGVNDLGYLAADRAGTLRFVSLVEQLPPAERQFGQVGQLVPAPAGSSSMSGSGCCSGMAPPSPPSPPSRASGPTQPSSTSWALSMSGAETPDSRG
jgi:hypothetical protein